MSSVSATNRSTPGPTAPASFAGAGNATTHTDAADTAASAANAETNGSGGGLANKTPLLDLTGIDLGARALSRQDLERWNPHRGDMALIDWIVWHSPDFRQGIALKQVRREEFWVPGHFPGKPMFPGVLMIETGAQLGVFLYNARFPKPKIAAFTRIEDASFRSAVEPGDNLVILSTEVRFSPRRFVSDIQGWVLDDRNQLSRLAFDARIHGVAIDDARIKI